MTLDMIGVKWLYSRPLVSEQRQELAHSVILVHLETVKGSTGRERLNSLLTAETKSRTQLGHLSWWFMSGCHRHCFAESPVPAATSRWARGVSWCRSRLASLWAGARCWPALYPWSSPAATKKTKKGGGFQYYLQNECSACVFKVWDFKAVCVRTNVCSWEWLGGNV